MTSRRVYVRDRRGRFARTGRAIKRGAKWYAREGFGVGKPRNARQPDIGIYLGGRGAFTKARPKAPRKRMFAGAPAPKLAPLAPRRKRLSPRNMGRNLKSAWNYKP